MDLNWQQKQLLQIHYDEQIDSPEKSFAVHKQADESGTECYFIEGVIGSQDGTDREIYKIYTTEDVDSLMVKGYIGIKHTRIKNSIYKTRFVKGEKNAHALWIKPEGKSLVAR